MKKPRISIICAVAAENNAIGKDNKLLWSIPEDLKRFKELTTGHPVIMGLNTYNSIGRPLPNRTNIVLTPDKMLLEGCEIAHSLKEAIETAQKLDNEEIFIIGGGMVYNEAIALTDRLYLTLVEGNYEADTFFPEYNDFGKIIEEASGQSSGYKYKYITLER